MTKQERNLIRDAMMFSVKDITGRVMREATVQSMIDDFKKAINYTESRKELEDSENRTIPKVSEEDRVKLDSGHNVSFYNFNIYDQLRELIT